jgi:putative ABC transport system permease protein
LICTVGYGFGIGLAGLFFGVGSAKLPVFAGFFLPWQIMIGTAVAIVAIVGLSGYASLRHLLMTDPATVFRA